ncbi:Os02g0191901 [Oryza sativa Japonica Group]|uniref:Os02g0191901 protein n=1 Tax=Oryza sativa subsp. japonica TaxID=39947 RepID=A0A0P0VFU5_ORYSJ|nr:Os02g0191901 [Oryza sativa Japonica Group]
MVDVEATRSGVAKVARLTRSCKCGVEPGSMVDVKATRSGVARVARLAPGHAKVATVRWSTWRLRGAESKGGTARQVMQRW